ncbi:hypothetical protein CAP35_12970 [Chitinophagaceae bacterium IBVUCB1]|nr:hypothetical protein CAP35_12970 [Chitinophagaceae bacterium IBVUCB1]
MLWFSDKKDLQYYNQSPGVPCYCEELIYPGDMILQGQIPGGRGSGNYNISIEVWSTDGNTAYEVATSYFDYYFFTNPTNQLHYFTARLKTFSPAMCAHKCFLMRVGITNAGDPNNYLFANWTERWCVSDCCDTAKGIVVMQDGVLAPPLVVGAASIAPAGPQKLNGCGEPMIRLISQFDCEDKFTGDYYGRPDVILTGSFVPFLKISNIKGRIVRRPREIKREMSYNCRLQQSESTAQYLLEGFEYFPPWKMAEIENQLHANHIWVDDYTNYKEYQYAGGTAFKQIHKCAELFKLETVLEDCTLRQIFGCGDCKNGVSYNGAMKMYAIPSSYQGGAFYNENMQLVADDYAGLLLYLRAQNGITQADDTDISELDADLYKVVSLSGTAALPSFFYYDAPLLRNRVYGRVVADAGDLAPQGFTCAQPIAGDVTITDIVCTAPTAGTVTVTDITPVQALVRSYGNWTVWPDVSIALINRNQVTLRIKTFTDTIVQAPDEDVLINYEVIGTVDAAARPQLMAVLTNANNDSIPIGVFISIDSMGLIRYSGSPTSADENGCMIDLANLVYNI